jgi:hypothetical protein
LRYDKRARVYPEETAEHADLMVAEESIEDAGAALEALKLVKRLDA